MKYLPKISHLQAFRQVARSGSIRAAARELEQSQPALSRTLRELEQTLGTQLLLRSKEGITLTEAGIAFSQRAEWVLEELRRAADEVDQINHFTHGTLTIGFSSLIALTVFPSVADGFKQALPQVRLTVKEGQLSSLLPGVRNGEIDLAIGSIDPMRPPQGVMIEPLFTAPFCIVARKGHPLAQAGDLMALRHAKWLLPESTYGYYQQLQNELTQFYHQIAITPLRTDSVITGLSMVLEADYLTIVARAMSHPLTLDDKLVVLPIQTLPAAQYCVVWSRKSALTTNARQFLVRLRETCRHYPW
ncbi:LysR substrate-binding domain-containing protein [Enterobacillus tribolii]|uniref:LysR family tdc operon transcriptional activator n=1 Tax=Enterobacillus tribolii TaxID=1487935 RepID=A0A370QNI8_9GAMM|nr:LysR substrate-binding domain-containing protein [Enterobacillus tribolii]MBW7982051.1 LysR family transcriptional regulator [Enterobacillus tribolii]RDK89929.1 LysR family tdc operon transcriptional activator [Enterobacillus tribolii]